MRLHVGFATQTPARFVLYQENFIAASAIVIYGGCETDKVKVLIAEIVAGAVILLTLYGLSTGIIGSYVAITEATGVYLVLFFILLLIMDIFLFVYTLRAWEHD
jgi:hypothetical protein